MPGGRDISSGPEVVFDSAIDGFAAVSSTVLEGSASLGKVGDILAAAGIAGTFAEMNFNKAVEDGFVDPEAEALVILTDDELVAKLKITVPHPPILIPGAMIITTKRVAVFKSRPTGGKLRAWKPRAYDRLIDDTGFEIVEKTDVIMKPCALCSPNGCWSSNSKCQTSLGWAERLRG